MILILPLINIITYIAVAYAIVLVIMLNLTWPPNSEAIYSSVKVAIAGSGTLGLLLYLFSRYAWRIIWTWFPSLNTALFPDLNGKWEMKIEWNRQGKSGVAYATAVIRQDLLNFNMEVHSKDSDSETLLAQPKKDAESGRPLLFYVYRVTPKRTAGRSDRQYLGTAVLKLPTKTEHGIQGNYFTDAITEGHFELTKTIT
jgi:SMODS-associating 2TM, beta-strand rich effector domain